MRSPVLLHHLSIRPLGNPRRWHEHRRSNQWRSNVSCRCSVRLAVESIRLAWRQRKSQRRIRQVKQWRSKGIDTNRHITMIAWWRWHRCQWRRVRKQVETVRKRLWRWRRCQPRVGRSCKPSRHRPNGRCTHLKRLWQWSCRRRLWTRAMPRGFKETFAKLRSWPQMSCCLSRRTGNGGCLSQSQ